MGNKGMMTVEASVVVPIILIIVVTEFFFGLFLIDMSVVKSETMRLADEAADVWKTDGKLADGTYKSQQLLLRNKNFLQKNRRGQLISKTRLRLQKRIATRLNIASLDSYKFLSQEIKFSFRHQYDLEILFWEGEKIQG